MDQQRCVPHLQKMQLHVKIEGDPNGGYLTLSLQLSRYVAPVTDPKPYNEAFTGRAKSALLTQNGNHALAHCPDYPIAYSFDGFQTQSYDLHSLSPTPHPLLDHPPLKKYAVGTGRADALKVSVSLLWPDVHTNNRYGRDSFPSFKPGRRDDLEAWLESP